MTTALTAAPTALLLTALAADPVQDAAAPESVRLTDLGRIVTITDVVHSPSGSGVVYTQRSIHGDVSDRDEDAGYRTHLWHVDPLTDRAAFPLTTGARGGSSPAISPDGRQLAFVRRGEDDRDGSGRSQVWLLALDRPGEARQLTELEGGARDPRWYPDGRALLVSTSVEQEDLEGLPPYDTERPGRAPLPADQESSDGATDDGATDDGATDDEAPAVEPDADLDTLREFLAGGATDADPTVAFDLDFQGELGLAGADTFSHLVRVDAGTGDSEVLADGWSRYGSARLSPDATRLVYVDRPAGTDHPDRVQRSSLYLFDLATSESTLLVDDTRWSAGSPRWSLDGGAVYFTVSDREDPTYAQTELARVSASGGAWQRLLPELDRHVQGLEVAAVGGAERVLFRSPSEGRVRLHAYDPASAALSTLAEVEGAVGAFAAGPNGVVLASSTAADPSRLHQRTAAGDLSTIAAPNRSWLDERQLSGPEWRWTEAPDGTRVQYWVMPPTGLAPGERAPVVLSLHGGPMVMWGPGSTSMWHEWQWLTANGYAVVYPNQRGSNGYGRDFQHANHRNWGAGPASDAIAALEAAAAEFAWIDTDRAVVTGGSYAGYLTAWIVGHDDRFQAAVAQRGVYDLVTFFGEGNAWRLVPYCFGGYPWEPAVREILVRESPFTYVDRITTPLLVMHASQDLRTGVSQSEMLYRALKVLERPVEYVRYPGAGHDLSRTGDPHQRMDRLGRILEFFERYVER